MSLADIDLFEVNEAFAAVVLRYLQAFDLDPARVNVNGGAIAMGHPLGATGAMLLGTVLDELERRDLSHGAGDALHRQRHGHRNDHRAGVMVLTGIVLRIAPRLPSPRRKPGSIANGSVCFVSPIRNEPSVMDTGFRRYDGKGVGIGKRSGGREASRRLP